MSQRSRRTRLCFGVVVLLWLAAACAGPNGANTQLDATPAPRATAITVTMEATRTPAPAPRPTESLPATPVWAGLYHAPYFVSFLYPPTLSRVFDGSVGDITLANSPYAAVQPPADIVAFVVRPLTTGGDDPLVDLRAIAATYGPRTTIVAAPAVITVNGQSAAALAADCQINDRTVTVRELVVRENGQSVLVTLLSGPDAPAGSAAVLMQMLDTLVVHRPPDPPAIGITADNPPADLSPITVASLDIALRLPSGWTVAADASTAMFEPPGAAPESDEVIAVMVDAMADRYAGRPLAEAVVWRFQYMQGLHGIFPDHIPLGPVDAIERDGVEIARALFVGASADEADFVLAQLMRRGDRVYLALAAVVDPADRATAEAVLDSIVLLNNE